jgi:cell division protein FtsL
MILFCNSSLKEDNKLTYEEINDTDEDINDTDKYKNQKEQFNNKKDYHSLDQISIKKVILFLILGALTLYGVYLIYIYFSTRKIVKKVGEINDLRTDMINLIISIDDCIDIINSQN